jgi:hypothetical protein
MTLFSVLWFNDDETRLFKDNCGPCSFYCLNDTVIIHKVYCTVNTHWKQLVYKAEISTEVANYCFKKYFYVQIK